MYPKPDVYTYSTIFSLLAKCGDVKSASLAESYLPKIAIAKNFDSPTYNSIISAWATVAQGLLRVLKDQTRYLNNYT
jgi:hypothetical protein